MSSSLLFEDTDKPWCNIRCNNLKLDTLEFVGGSGSGRLDLVGSIGGTFVVAPQPIDIVAYKIGDLVTIRYAPVNIANSNQTASGSITITTTGLPASWNPRIGSSWVVSLSDVSSSARDCLLQQSAVGIMQFFNPYNGNTFTKAAGSVTNAGQYTTISWLL